MSDPTTEAAYIEALQKRLNYWIDAAAAATARIIVLENTIKSVQAELLAGGSPARLRAIVGIKQETDTNAERS